MGELSSKSEAQFTKLFELNRAIMLLIDPGSGAIIQANQAASDFYGWSLSELRTMRIQQINTLPPETVMDEVHKTLSAGSLHWVFKHRRADGSIRDVDVFSSKIELADKNFLCSIVHDITDRKRAEAENSELEARNRQVQKFESLNRMARAIAHNFNNQLQVVIGNLEMAIEDLPKNSFTAEKLTAALKAAHRAAQISGSMVSYRGQNAGNRQPQDLSRICRRGFVLLQAAVPKNVTIETHFPDSGPVVHADADQIKQMLTILATNAWEAFDQNQGMVRLTVKTVDELDIPLSNRFPVNWQPQESVYACLEVVDKGCGIMCCDTDNLFDPFFTTKFIGRGMGLSVVLGIVQAHGGAITVESEPGSGSVFRVFLPVCA
jgi:PAS domain S-box-containing protein